MRRNSTVLLMTLLLVAPLLACSAETGAVGIIDIDNQKLQSLLAQGVPLVDVRTEAEWRETGVIAGSHLLTFFDARGRYDTASWLAKLSQIVSPEQPLILICRSGHRSAAVAKLLVRQAGYREVYSVKQGINGWLADGRPIQPR